MVDLTEFKNPIEDAIERIHEEKLPRPYLGCSSIGHSCDRHLWYQLRWAHKNFIPSKLLRIFERGDLEEERIVRLLEKIGCLVEGRQYSISDFGGHFGGHIDGLVTGVPGAEKTTHLLEIKTANDRNWKMFKKDGVKLNSAKYYAQVQLYMGYLKLKRALFVCVNKNDEQIYFERIKFDESEFKFYKRKAFSILSSEEIPDKIGDATWYECKFCSSFDICHGGAKELETCRMCKHSSIADNRSWECELHKKNLTLEEQENGCKDFTRL